MTQVPYAIEFSSTIKKIQSLWQENCSPPEGLNTGNDGMLLLAGQQDFKIAADQNGTLSSSRMKFEGAGTIFWLSTIAFSIAGPIETVGLDWSAQNGISGHLSLHRREAHHIHNRRISGKLSSGKSLFPGGQDHSHLLTSDLPLRQCAGFKSTAEGETLNQRRAVDDHDAHRELGGSANAAEADCPADSGGMRGLLQSPPRLVLLIGQFRTCRS